MSASGSQEIGLAVGPIVDDRRVLNLELVARQLLDQHEIKGNPAANGFSLERILSCFCKMLAVCREGALTWHQFFLDEEDYRSKKVEWEQLAVMYWEDLDCEEKEVLSDETMNAFSSYLAKEYQSIMAAFFIKVAGTLQVQNLCMSLLSINE